MSDQCVEITKKGTRCKLKVSDKNNCGLCAKHYNIKEKEETLDENCERKTRPVSPPREKTRPVSPPREKTRPISFSNKSTSSQNSLTSDPHY